MGKLVRRLAEGVKPGAETNRAVDEVRPQPIGTRLVEALFQDELLQLHRALLLAHFSTGC